MAEGALAALGDRIERGLIVTKVGHGRAVGEFALREAGHPLPDARSEAAAEEALDLARSLQESACLLVLLSGGASSLWCAPAHGIELAEKQELTRRMLDSGLEIRAINSLRKHLSRIKGGALAQAAFPARVLTLAISDVEGGQLDAIGSGPTVPDPTTYADALAVLEEAQLTSLVPDSVAAHLRAGQIGARPETAKPGAVGFDCSEARVVASLETALDAATDAGQALGLRVRTLGAMLYGEARQLATRLARETRAAQVSGIELLIAGGEPTVTVRGKGRGGRAQELSLAFALELAATSGVSALFAGTDGSDGPTEAAGGFSDGGTLGRAKAGGIDARAALEQNASHDFLAAAGDLFISGPTDTNVNDLALIRIQPTGEPYALAGS